MEKSKFSIGELAFVLVYRASFCKGSASLKRIEQGAKPIIQFSVCLKQGYLIPNPPEADFGT